MEQGNYYEDKAKRQFVNQTKKNATLKTGEMENSTEKGKNTATAVKTDLVIRVLGGDFMAAAIGKPAMFVGLAISGYGHYAQNKMISALGLGIMASGTMSTLNERVRAFGEELKRKLLLDKLLADKVENLAGTKQAVMNQPPRAPQTSNFVQYQDWKQERLTQGTPDFKGKQDNLQKDETEF